MSFGQEGAPRDQKTGLQRYVGLHEEIRTHVHIQEHSCFKVHSLGRFLELPIWGYTWGTDWQG